MPLTPMPAGSLAFLSWARQGLAGALLKGSGVGANAGRLQLPLSLRLQAGSDSQNLSESTRVERPIRFHGPQDVLGIDPRQVIRTDPVDLATNFEPNLFPLVEFDRPDLPWMFTPQGPASPDRWQPWITLIVVPAAAATVLTPNAPTQSLPTIACPVAELPPLAEAWAWCHVQLMQGSDPLPVDKLLEQDARGLSRLVCPRRLDPRTSYVACVVPTYELGRRAGLREAVTPADQAGLALAPAWLSDGRADQQVVLPVYYHWSFSTGDAGDFESLAQLVKPRSLPAGAGTLVVDTSRPGWGMPTVPDASPTSRLPVQGALRPRGPPIAGWSAADGATFTKQLANILNGTAGAATPAGPLIGPPIYGQGYVQTGRIPEDTGRPAWLRDLNLRPEHRIAAGLGALVVRYEQDALVAAAWDQLATFDRDNQGRKRRQLAEAAQASLAAKLDAGTGAPGNLRRLARRGTAWQRQKAAGMAGFTARGVAAAAVRRTLTSFENEVPSAPIAATELKSFAPEFGTAMVEPMLDYFREFLLPGLDGIAADSIAQLESNDEFVEAFLLGLNHEMGRELAWRGFPAAPRTTFFRTFWNRGAHAGSAQADMVRDVTPIADWHPDSALGTHDPAPEAAQARSTIFIVRGQLLQRYPRATILAQRASWSDDGAHVLGSERLLPSFNLFQPPDIAVFGFDLSPQEMHGAKDPSGDAGWFLVIQAPLGEPRFGLEVATSVFGAAPAYWRELSWSNVAKDSDALRSLRHLPLSALSADTTRPVLPSGRGTTATWAARSSEMALITQRLPGRLTIHASIWLGLA